jgi:DNA polymerase epsilon subunit 1
MGLAFIINFQPETDLFATQSRPQAEQMDIEDIASKPQEHGGTVGRPVVTKRKRLPSGTTSSLTQSTTLTQSWRDVLGPPPPLGNTKVCNSYDW